MSKVKAASPSRWKPMPSDVAKTALEVFDVQNFSEILC